MHSQTESLEKLYAQKKHCIKYLCSKTTCSYEEAYDIFIEAVIEFEQRSSLNEINELKDLTTYFYRICFNHWKRTYYKRKRQSTAQPNVVRYFYEFLNDNAESLKEEKITAIENALDELDNNCMEVISSFYYYNQSMSEIAIKMDLKNAVVARTVKYRCINKVKKLLGLTKKIK